MTCDGLVKTRTRTFFATRLRRVNFRLNGGNRGRYSSIRLDELLKTATETTDMAKRKDLYQEIQRLLADEIPAVPLWCPENNVVHTRRVTGVVPSVNGDFSFLRTAELQ